MKIARLAPPAPAASRARPTAARSLAAGALGVLCVAVISPSAAGMTPSNLVSGGDAEAPVGAEWVLSEGGLARAPYGQGGYPSAVLIGGGTFDGETSMLLGTGASMVATQTVVLGAEDREAIDTGTVSSRLSAYLGGYGAQDDRVGVEVHWRGDDGASLLTQDLPVATAADRGGLSGFLRRQDDRPVPIGARTVEVTLRGQRFVGSSQDGYLDNLELRLVGVPQLRPAFSLAGSTVGTPTSLTLTVQNSEDLEAKAGWGFRLRLPDGLRVSSSTAVRTTCASSSVWTTDRGVEAAGSSRPNEPACAITVGVVATTAGTYEIGPRAVASSHGLRGTVLTSRLQVDPEPVAPPAGSTAPGLAPAPRPQPLTGTTPAPPPGPPPERPTPSVPASPPLRRPPDVGRQLQLTSVRRTSSTPGGRRVRLRARIQNRTGTAVRDIVVCVRRPAGTAVVPTPSDGVVVGRERCWKIPRLAAHAGRTVSLTVRSGRRTRAFVVRWRADADDATGVLKHQTTIQIAR